MLLAVRIATGVMTSALSRMNPRHFLSSWILFCWLLFFLVCKPTRLSWGLCQDRNNKVSSFQSGTSMWCLLKMSHTFDWLGRGTVGGVCIKQGQPLVLKWFIYSAIHATTFCHTFRINKNSINLFQSQAQTPPPPHHATIQY